MKNLRKIFVAALLLGATLQTHAQVTRLVIDPQTIAALEANTAAIKLIEDEHNQELDSISDKQKRMAKYSATMESIKELYKMSMQNVRGFGQESAYYKELVYQFSQVPGNSAKAIKAIKKCPFVNYINALNEISDIQMDCIGTVKLFIDVVNNGKISLKDFTSGKDDALSNLLKNAETGKGDGYNFMDRYTRLTLCNSLLSRITDINIQLQQIVYVCEYGRTLSNLFYNLDPDGWINYMTGKNIVESVINDFNYELKYGW